jgi:nucleoside-diphosphate-sugar epimerase
MHDYYSHQHPKYMAILNNILKRKHTGIAVTVPHTYLTTLAHFDGMYDNRGHVNPIGPRACYDEGKRVAETMCYSYEKQQGVEVRVARIFNTYGPRMNLNDGRVVSNFIKQALNKEPITIYGAYDHA